MSVTAYVVVKDQAGNRIGILDDWVKLSYTLSVNQVATHSITLDADDPKTALFADDDCQIEVYREDKAEGWGPLLDYEGLHRASAWELLASGEELFTSAGLGYLTLIEGRTILYPSESAGAMKSGPGETVILDYVSENAGPIVAGRLFPAAQPGLLVAPSAGRGTAWQGDRSRNNLLSVCQEIAQATGMNFGVTGIGPGAFLFEARPIWGVDRSTAGLAPSGLNAAGNIPHVFDSGLGNMQNPSVVRNRLAEVNTVYVAGQGASAGKTVIRRQNASAAAVSPWALREGVKTAPQEGTTAGLAVVGDATLNKLLTFTEFKFDVLQTPASRYGVEYRFGDLVTARYRGISADFQIAGVSVTMERQQGETVSIRVGRPAGEF